MALILLLDRQVSSSSVFTFLLNFLNLLHTVWFSPCWENHMYKPNSNITKQYFICNSPYKLITVFVKCRYFCSPIIKILKYELKKCLLKSCCSKFSKALIWQFSIHRNKSLRLYSYMSEEKLMKLKAFVDFPTLPLKLNLNLVCSVKDWLYFMYFFSSFQKNNICPSKCSYVNSFYFTLSNDSGSIWIFFFHFL